jgi:hypothetical protein
VGLYVVPLVEPIGYLDKRSGSMDYERITDTIRNEYDESGDYCVSTIAIKPFVISENPGYDYGEEESRLVLDPTHVILVSLVSYEDEDEPELSVCEEWVVIEGDDVHFAVDEWYADPADYPNVTEGRVAEILDEFNGTVIYTRGE